MKVLEDIVLPQGFKVSGIHVGIRKIKRDLGIIYTEKPAVCSATFSKSSINGAGIVVSKENCKNNIRAVVINSGNANVFTGQRGIDDAKRITQEVATTLKINDNEVLINSTGVTGEFLNVDKIVRGIKGIVSDLSDDKQAILNFNESILTTDLKTKYVAVEVDNVKMVGIAKGSGMINPNMATTITSILTDADISKDVLDKIFKDTINKTLNRISIDGETSPNDMAYILANGVAGGINEDKFRKGLEFVLEELAKKIVEDGEGATKLIQIDIEGTKTEDDADKIFKNIANSPLVRTTFFGENANWGRIVSAIVKSGINFDYNKTIITFSSSQGSINVCENGNPVEFDELKMKQILQDKIITIIIKLQEGDIKIRGWTCDLTYDYIKINSSYRDGRTNMEKFIERANILTEALPYINRFNNTKIVIKYGGSALVDEDTRKITLTDISLLSSINIHPIVVHGGGPAINEALKKQNIQPVFKNGLRVTDIETMKIVESVLSGETNKSIVNDLQKYGANAVGISGKDGNLFIAEKTKEDIGFVGDIKKVNPKIIQSLVENNFVPVISPVSADLNFNSYNVNADYAAVELAIAMKAEKLIFLTDVDGIMIDPNDPNTLISSATVDELLNLIDRGIISGGMIPKVKSCIRAIENGVEAVQMLNAKIKHSLLLEVFTRDGVGTLISK
ncbi:MAG: bifunctional glutamate N-acetyltransferase/amino-acid acetyltransferase ArgJ [Rickettsiales bacterium]|jgi:glutamate N-acetyltransferase/amino-acid acetyltransferase|nr:bifunctional glutamate N-acetyltransferase/amino-acid acetyltransferase ArgJ [Rickettsiales bacterium]